MATPWKTAWLRIYKAMKTCPTPKENRMDLHLRDKVAIVTGGSRGLGRAISLGLAAEGVRVAVNYLQNAPRAEQAVAEIGTTYGVEALAVKADVSRKADVSAMFGCVEERFSQIDILVNNAGIWPTAYVKDMTEQEWTRTLAVNLTGPFLTCREAVRRWLKAGRTGRIVNVSTQAAFRGSTTGHAHYAASKAGLVTFTVSLAREVAPHGIHVNAVAPGMMATEMARNALVHSQEEYLKRIPVGRIADPAEIADVVVFLASDRASYMTGATVDVTGGMLMR
jgi:3-oxoacyl-[acyl-carrier protein] reductase